MRLVALTLLVSLIAGCSLKINPPLISATNGRECVTNGGNPAFDVFGNFVSCR